MTTDKAIEIANKMQLANNPLWVEIKRLACDYEKQIAELERKLEQTEKDLSDYQFNYPTIKELQKENAELKEEGKKSFNDWLDVCDKYGKVNLKLTKAKDLLAKWVELYNPKLEGFPKTPVQEETERFLTENK